jgi:hypothetical protein
MIGETSPLHSLSALAVLNGRSRLFPEADKSLQYLRLPFVYRNGCMSRRASLR